MIKKILSILFAASSCTTNVVDTIKTYSIEDITKTDKIISLNDLKSKVKLVKLETTDESMLGPIIKIIHEGSFVYVLTLDGLFQFSSEGKFLQEISSKGRANNEHIGAFDFFLNPENGNIYINDHSGYKIMEYYPSGEFIVSYKTIPTLEIGNSFMGKDGCLFKTITPLNGNERYQLIMQNFSGDTIAKCPNYIKYKNNKYNYIYNDSKNIFNLDGDLVYHQLSSDTVHNYNYESKKLEVRYAFSNPTPSTGENFRYHCEIAQNKLSNLNNYSKDISLIYDIAEDKNYIYVTIFTTKNGNQLYLIDKETEEYYKANFKIDSSSSKNSHFYPKWQEGDILVNFVQLDEGENPAVITIQSGK